MAAAITGTHCTATQPPNQAEGSGPAGRSTERSRFVLVVVGNGPGMSGSETSNTFDPSKTELGDMKVDQLRDLARKEGIDATSSMRKDELVDAISAHHRKQGGRQQPDQASEPNQADSDEPGRPGDAGPDGGRVRRGSESSKSLQYSQEITSPEDEPERAGRSLATSNHEVIRQWAEARNAVPATVAGTEHGDHLGVLRFDFGGDDEGRLRHVSWEEWFATFDERSLNFLYQEERKDGRQSNFFRLENPNREDA